jgi:death-on-curing protein
MGALESAVATPAQTYDDQFLHDDIFRMAAAYAFHIAENQPFIDGNKRTGLNAALVFLDINGFLVADPDMRLYEAVIALPAHSQLNIERCVDGGLTQPRHQRGRARGQACGRAAA